MSKKKVLDKIDNHVVFKYLIVLKRHTFNVCKVVLSR